MCNSQHKHTAALSGAVAIWFKRDTEKVDWKVTSSYQIGRKFTSTNQVVLHLIQKVHALAGKEHLYYSKNQHWSPRCHFWFNFTSSHTHSFIRKCIVTTGVRVTAPAVIDLKAKWALAGGWAAETHFGYNIKVCVSHTMPLPAVRFLWASSNQLQAVRHISMSSLNKRWEIT